MDRIFSCYQMLLVCFLALGWALRRPNKNLRAATQLKGRTEADDTTLSIMEEIRRANQDEDDEEPQAGWGIKRARKNVSGERKMFAHEMEKWRDSLLPEGKQWQESLLAQIKDHTPERTEQLVAKWQPVDCEAAGYDLEKVKRVYGKKSHNQVLKMRDANTKKFYALKLYGKATDFSTELGFFMFADLPYILKPVCVVRDLKIPMRPGIVFEWIESGDSLAYAKNPATTPEDLLRISAQLLVALEYVHWLGFSHADLKPENVMVDEEGNIKLIDFGYALPTEKVHKFRGNNLILAPELADLVEAESMTEAIDWYAYASTLAAWYAFKYIPDYRYGVMDSYHGYKDEESYDQKRTLRFYLTRINKNGKGFHFGVPPVDFPLELRQLIYLLTDLDPAQRRFASAQEVSILKSIPFFANLSWKHVPKFK